MISKGGYGEPSHELLRAMTECEASGQPLGLLVVQINELEKVEAALGFSASTALANDFCGRVRKALRNDDQLFQVGDRKFWVILKGVKNLGHAELAANKLSRIGKETFQIGSHSLKLETVIGIAMYPEHAADPDDLGRRADLALNSARESGLPFSSYSEDSTREMASLWAMGNELDRALEESEFELYYQVKLDLQSMRPCGAEALLRWNNPARGLLAPGAFLPIAEQTGKLEAMTWFVIDAAQRQRCEWPEHWGELPVSVNIPPCVLESGKLISYITNSMSIWGSRPGHLILEITEDAVVRNPKSSFAALGLLRKAGIQVSIDDFGTGYSSMSYFKDMPADEIKIDKSFMKNLVQDVGNQHIVRAVIDLAHAFHYKVVAEGVESEDVLDVLKGMQCDIVQGFLFARPQPQADFIQWLTDYGRNVFLAKSLEPNSR
jgi:diguanylate cyclase (GGDEF)-like protein